MTESSYQPCDGCTRPIHKFETYIAPRDEDDERRWCVACETLRRLGMHPTLEKDEE